jgi:hypothetical protein
MHGDVPRRRVFLPALREGQRSSAGSSPRGAAHPRPTAAIGPRTAPGHRAGHRDARQSRALSVTNNVRSALSSRSIGRTRRPNRFGRHGGPLVPRVVLPGSTVLGRQSQREETLRGAGQGPARQLVRKAAIVMEAGRLRPPERRSHLRRLNPHDARDHPGQRAGPTNPAEHDRGSRRRPDGRPVAAPAEGSSGGMMTRPDEKPASSSATCCGTGRMRSA